MTRPIFLLSLPRAGSTLLQRLLLASGRCATLGEPSLLLRFLGGDEVVQRRASYWESLVETAEGDMRRQWSGFDEAYRAGVRRLMEGVYDGLSGDKDWFLDKTPRYSLIVEDLFQTFPDAKFIVLWRHPLAVAASICTTFRGDRWCPDEFAIDLHEGMKRLMDFARLHADHIIEVKYEDLVESPAAQLKRVGDYLGWPELDKIANVNLPESAGGTLGDSTGVKQYSKVASDSRDAWKAKIRNWYRSGWCRDYWSGPRAQALEALGYELPGELGSGRWMDGLVDWLSAKNRIHRRIVKPTWLRRHSKQFRMRNGYGVLFR